MFYINISTSKHNKYGTVCLMACHKEYPKAAVTDYEAIAPPLQYF